jgi:hypothetical protein
LRYKKPRPSFSSPTVAAAEQDEQAVKLMAQGASLATFFRRQRKSRRLDVLSTRQNRREV